MFNLKKKNCSIKIQSKIWYAYIDLFMVVNKIFADKATSNLRLEPDWPAILQICDLIRQGDVQ